MRSSLAAVLVLLTACFGAPRSRSPGVPVPATFSVGGEVAVDSELPPRPAGITPTVPSTSTVATRPLTSRSVLQVGSFSRNTFLRDIGDTTLEQLIMEAHRANTDVRVAEARLVGARASRRLASLDLVPTVTGIASSTRQQQSMALVPGLRSQLPQQELWDVGFDASWEVDIFGRVARNVRARQALVASAEHSLDDVNISVTAEVARSYFELRGAQQQLQVARRSAENQRRIVKLTEERLAAGRGTAFDTERAKSVLYLTLASTPALESQIALQRQRLGVLLGRAPGALPPALLESAELPLLPDTLYVGSAEQLMRRRPDVMAAERRLAAQTLLVGAARAEYLPRLTLGARAGYVATSFDSIGRTGTSRFIAGPLLTLPLFDVGRVHERVEVAQAYQDEAEADRRATVVRALSETDAALTTYDRAHARLAILADAVASSARASELAQQRFEAGLTDLLQVLDAQRTLLEAENQLVMGHTTAATALVAVYKAVGGTWPVR